ncbi:site-specific DNA-methyltransferase [PVC group bacterium]|nr:site-specific DNA-methyltransferase [PVC group bacterium]
MPKQKSPRNRTLTLSDQEQKEYKKRLLRLRSPVSVKEILRQTICQDLFETIPYLPSASVDLMFIDPPYNLNKTFHGHTFTEISLDKYIEYVDTWLKKLIRLLKPTASVYICADWRSSSAIQMVAQKYLKVINRITWEREKGRGANHNWKNACEDIWFCTMTDDFTFNVESVKTLKPVLAPYKENGKPKDWTKTPAGNFRMTHPSNLWCDLTIPYWSMAENTDHPTQKPEKLLAKIILAATRPGEVVFDPFGGSGTTSVVAKKLGRNFFSVEINEYYACLTEKRLELANDDTRIQGYENDIFWPRNTPLSARKKILFAPT